MVFSSCTAANFALLDTVTTADDAIFSDELNHASIIDGCRLSRARVVKVKHCSAESFLQGLEQSSSAKSQRRKLLITDGVFSMEGYTAPLPQFLEATTGSDTMLAIDESHAAGVVGKTGRGSAELRDCMDKIDYCTGTLSKAFGAVGGGYISLLHQHALATNRVQHLQQETPHQLLRRNARPATFRVSPYIRANTSSMHLSASLSHEGSDATDGPAME
jgi:7-keto-8-aminopelargonate synthetase-like enzyme